MLKLFLFGGVLLFGSMEMGAKGLVGDGAHDDTAAIQAMLDSGRSLVYLPPPPKEYVISRTLKIGSGTELRLDRLTRIRLAPNSNCPMLQNRDYYYGTNVDIVVTGGVWDFDNPHQEPNPYKMKRATMKLPHPEKEFWDPDNFISDWNLGVLMRFSGIRHLEVRDLTLENPTLYGLAINRAEYFTVDHIYFDYNRWNPLPINMDGVHLDSNCRFGRIAHVRGNTFDDMVALNTNDWWDKGPITDIVIEDVYADAGFRAVRLLSKSPSAPVKRVVIRDVRGRYYRDVIGFTRYFEGGDARGFIDDVVVENVFASKDPPPEFRKEMTVSPLIWFQGGLDVGRVSIRNLSREETKWDRPTFLIEKGVKVKDLIVRDAKMVNRIGRTIPFYECDGIVENPIFENLCFEGEWTRTGSNSVRSEGNSGEDGKVRASGAGIPVEMTAVSRMEDRTKDPCRDPGLFGDYWWANRFLSRHNLVESYRGKVVDVVMLGDSIMHFWEWKHPESWRRFCAERAVLNLGYGGDRTENVIWRLMHGELDGYEAKNVVVMIGTNNNSSNADPANVARGIERIIEIVKERQPRARIVLHPIFPRGNGASSRLHALPRHRNEKTNADLREFAKAHPEIFWIDFNEKLLNDSGWVPKSIMADEIHPTDAGYEIWTDALSGVFQ